MTEKLLFQCTHGKEDPERAILPFVAANVAAIAGQDTVVILTIEGVWLGTKGGTDGIEKAGFPNLTELYAEFIENGGQVWLCGTCAKPAKSPTISSPRAQGSQARRGSSRRSSTERARSLSREGGALASQRRKCSPQFLVVKRSGRRGQRLGMSAVSDHRE